MEDRKKQLKSVVLYGIFGILTTVVNIAIYHFCYEVWNITNVPSNIIAWVLAVAVAYITNKLWVFDSKRFAIEVLLPELWKFVSCRLVTGIIDLIIMWVGVDLLRGPAVLIKTGSNVLVIVFNYMLSKLVVFRKET